MGYRVKQKIHNTWISNGHGVNKEIINILSHQGMQIKMALQLHLIPIAWLIHKAQTRAHAGEVVEKKKHSSIADWFIKLYILSENQPGSSSENGNSSTWRSRYTTPGRIPKRYSNISEGYIFHYVHSVPIHNIPKLKATQMAHSEWIQKM